MIFQILLYTALALLMVGLVYRFQAIARKQRFFEKDRDTWAKKIFIINFKGFLLNTLFQLRLFRAGKFRWLAHFLVISGFVYLVAVHALDDVTYGMFAWYQPTIDPFRFLRNLAGSGVTLGCGLFLLRRLTRSRINQDHAGQGQGFRFRFRFQSRFQFRGTVSILLILALVLSGFLLEASRIISEPRFDEMVEEYSDLDGEDDLIHLKAFWAENYHVIFKENFFPAQTDLETGETLNEDYCVDCHARPDSAFVSAPLAKAVKTKAGKTKIAKTLTSWLARTRVDNILYWFHYAMILVLLCFLPFSRMFHLITVPVASTRKRITPQNLKKEMGYLDVFSLSGCTNCGFCSEVCSVYPNFQITGNPEILPHVKIDAVKTMAGKGLWDAKTVGRLRSGNDDCTLCGRCADICPSGIDLVRLWEAADHLMANLGCQDNYTLALEASFDEWAKQGQLPSDPDASPSMDLGLSDQVEAFEHCVQCTICTNTCPVVVHDLNQNDFGPHQVMNLLRLGKKQMAQGSRMVWNCLTCYSCQELCPQGIRVTDILLELRSGGQKTTDRIKLSKLNNQVSDK
jgi:heterodisulfide reductase subunit C